MNRTALLTLAAGFLWASTALAAAPQPAKPVDPQRLYSGRWLEIARTPMFITDGCVAGATNYEFNGKDRVSVRDTCEVGAPGGKEKVIEGRGELLDPGTLAKLRVRYPFLITWDYWILDRDDDYQWFIAGDPKLKRIFIFTREVPSAELKTSLTRKVEALGYDMSRIEFPAQPPVRPGAPSSRKP
ncbi:MULTISPECIES: lipocalin family protein [unclassified Caulobacter]|uniref:lipocalin family protein n=1 Tax=unclassified Caulobacter TaxID=2648921 RepID=UPI000D337C21|nr:MULTISPECIES: lipocalin family protein [unclassified Caulobacter]PTS91230.1 lipocalin [Caulobacter sp. HMWF009]PTT10240.1 lipocalin [Caulobacter sp. HMWF025]